MFAKHCPHCSKKIPWRKRLRPRCPFCFKAYRRASGIKERSTVGLWLEDRSTNFWFFMLLIVTLVLSMVLQVFRKPDLLNFIDSHPVWYVLSLFWLAMFMATIMRIYFPLMLNAPRILRTERAAIRQYRILTAAGLIVGVGLALLLIGPRDFWAAFPGTAFLMMVPVAVLWSYHALTLSEDDYEDDRVSSFLHEIGAADRLEHRHNAFFVLFGIPACSLVFYYFVQHPFLAHMIQESADSGIIAMFLELWHRTTRRG
jgi:hypothetical protein